MPATDTLRQYVASGYDPAIDDHREELFAASDPEEAVRIGLERLPDAEMIGAARDGVVETVWERSPDIYLKYLADGSKDLDEVIGRLVGLADELRAMADADMTLDEASDGHIRLTRARLD